MLSSEFDIFLIIFILFLIILYFLTILLSDPNPIYQILPPVSIPIGTILSDSIDTNFVTT